MVNVTYSYDAPSSVAPARLFKSLVLDHTFLTKAVPHAFKSIEKVSGDGGAGTIYHLNFGEGSKIKSAKHRVDGLDKDNYSTTYTVIDVEADEKSDVIESVTYELKIVASGDGGSIIKTTSTYHTKGDAQISEEEIKVAKERGFTMFKTIEAYLNANPDAYN